MYYILTYRLGGMYVRNLKDKQNEHKTNSSSKNKRRTNGNY